MANTEIAVQEIRINHIRLWWFALTREDKFTGRPALCRNMAPATSTHRVDL
jgi:hypothetical protein